MLIGLNVCLLATGGVGTCNSEQFNCKNSRCISRENICDYTDDCGNYEDERQETCGKIVTLQIIQVCISYSGKVILKAFLHTI